MDPSPNAQSPPDQQMAIVPYKHANPYVNPWDMNERRIKVTDDVALEFIQKRSVALGGVMWDASIVLSNYLSTSRKLLLSGRRAVELGSGIGLVGMTAAVLGADVTLTEHCDEADLLRLLRENVALNSNKLQSAAGSAVVRPYTWGEGPALEAPYDVILGADVIYHERAFAPLVKALMALSDESTVVIIAYKHRYLKEEKFFRLARVYFDVNEVENGLILDYYRASGIHLYEMKKKPGAVFSQSEGVHP